MKNILEKLIAKEYLTASEAEKSLIEIDEYPKASVYRENMANELPPGIAMVSFYVDSIPNTLPFIST